MLKHNLILRSYVCTSNWIYWSSLCWKRNQYEYMLHGEPLPRLPAERQSASCRKGRPIPLALRPILSNSLRSMAWSHSRVGKVHKSMASHIFNKHKHYDKKKSFKHFYLWSHTFIFWQTFPFHPPVHKLNSASNIIIQIKKFHKFWATNEWGNKVPLMGKSTVAPEIWTTQC